MLIVLEDIGNYKKALKIYHTALHMNVSDHLISTFIVVNDTDYCLNNEKETLN